MFVTIIGSTRFEKEAKEEAKRLTYEGYNVLELTCLDKEKVEGNDNLKRQLDDAIREKIDISSIVHVINKDGYIGKSTLSEIQYARKKLKMVTYMEPIEKSNPEILSENKDEKSIKVDFDRKCMDTARQVIELTGDYETALAAIKQVMQQNKDKINKLYLYFKDDIPMPDGEDIIAAIKSYRKIKKIYTLMLGMKPSDYTEED